MKRLSQNCFTISSSELKFGWSAEQQLLKNPEAKREFPECRIKEARKLWIRRSNQWVLRSKKSKDPEDLRRAAYALDRASKLGEP